MPHTYTIPASLFGQLLQHLATHPNEVGEFPLLAQLSQIKPIDDVPREAHAIKAVAHKPMPKAVLPKKAGGRPKGALAFRHASGKTAFELATEKKAAEPSLDRRTLSKWIKNEGFSQSLANDVAKKVIA